MAKVVWALVILGCLAGCALGKQAAHVMREDLGMEVR